jgi:[ribosomal protein S5]-alanine N-acetyltransferase
MSFQIATERLILRDVRAEDLPVLLEQAAEPAARSGILAYQADEEYNRKYFVRAIAEGKFAKRENYTLSVTLKAGAPLIGSCMIHNVRPGSIETSLGWHYGSAFWGHGYATEAARVLLHIGFRLGDAAEIYADCFADNRASIRVMEKIGMTTRQTLGLLNTIRGWSYGETRPAVRYTISRDQWRG